MTPEFKAQYMPSIAIIGSGFGGLAAAVELKRHGLDNFTIYERATGVGGVWRDNTYPGAACDVRSPVYSYSFAQEYEWSGHFGTQAEIRDYLEGVVDEFALEPHLRCGTEVTAATFDATDNTWRIEFASGESAVVDAVIMATGQLSRPKIPALVGMETFEGPSFHSANWDHSVELTGKRVIVVGSGASAVQIVPAIVDTVAELVVIQRSPNWVTGKSARRNGRVVETLLRRSALARRLQYLALFAAYESTWPLVSRRSTLARAIVARQLKRRIRRQLVDPDKVAVATPAYTVLCNRLLLSDDWYPSLAKDHVALVASAVERVTAGGVVTADGREVRGEVIVWCTGFKADEFLVPIRVVGLNGTDLHQTWQGGAEAYLGITVPDFPNLFMLYGPNTNSLTNSIVYLLERQAAYIRRGLQALARAGGGGSFDARSHVHQRYQQWLRRQLDATVFTDECPGWYTNDTGKVTAMWPRSHLTYARMTRVFDTADYLYRTSNPQSAEEKSALRGVPSTTGGRE